MKKRLFLALAISTVMTVAAPEAEAAHTGKITNWVMNPDEGFAQARREGKPIMIFFTADW